MVSTIGPPRNTARLLKLVIAVFSWAVVLLWVGCIPERLTIFGVDPLAPKMEP